MVHVIKVNLEDPKNGNQIRRLAVSSDVASDFHLLKDKIKSLFQLQNNYFEMKWKDSDNDFILMSSDEELAQALANAEDGLLRVYLYIKDDAQTKPKTPEVTQKAGIEHSLVTCDGCEKKIFGDRYKCLQCKNFDLCSLCNTANKHPDHDLIKLVKPSYIPREWVFCGARKIWKSMFGLAYAMQCQEKDESKSSTPQNPNRENLPKQPNNHQGMPDIFSNIMKGDLAEAQKFLSEAVGTISNLLPGGIEVTLEQNPFKAECKVKPSSKKAKAKKESSTTCSSSKQNEKASKAEGKKVHPQKVKFSFDKIKEVSLPVPTEPKKFETTEIILLPAKFDTGGLFPLPTQVLCADKVTTSVAEASEKAECKKKSHATTEIECKEKSPATEKVECKEKLPATEKVDCKEMSPASDNDTSNCEEGWIFIPVNETNKQEPSCTAKAVAETVTEAKNDIQCVKLEEIKGKLEDGSVIQTGDPKIINALIKMQAMGFTNEGGWLERLLITKHGNINEALDALYPFAQRQ